MECMLVPKNPTAPLMRVPHLDPVVYDGGEWFNYPQRRGKDWPKLSPDDTISISIYMSKLPNSREIEPFLQTWLFFGLLLEFFGGNDIGTSQVTPGPSYDVPDREVREETVRRMYTRYSLEGEDAGGRYITTATLLQDMEEEVKRSISDALLFKNRCMRLHECLQLAWKVIRAAPTDFDPNIRASIGAIAELLSQAMNIAFLLYRLPQRCPEKWNGTYFDEEPARRDGFPTIRQTMVSNGWCPSDISRCLNKFHSFQVYHFLGQMSKSSPPRAHSRCNDEHCTAYQINKDYEVRHVCPGRSCQLVHVENSAVISILEKEGKIPLLRFVGGIDDLKIEVVESSMTTPYVAISHVWADGLGNQKANALNSCELIRLRTLVEALGRQVAPKTNPTSPDHGEKSPFIWIDTICCPVEPIEAKAMALGKLRQVYLDAHHVLVLDAGLEVHKAQEIELIEVLARIFTSGWLRRLWTLQEGALAKSLYFQFADCAISLDSQDFLGLQNNRQLRHRIFVYDFLADYKRLRSFFPSMKDNAGTGHAPLDLNLVNAALQYRSVSVPSDEPLCLASLLSIPTTSLLEKNVERGDRIKILWQLIAKANGGIPASIIFLEDPRIDAPAWRWAPASLLKTAPQQNVFDFRILLWSDKSPGWPTSYGLKVKLPGYRLLLGNVDDGKPRHPWKGMSRIPERDLFCRDINTGKWYHIFDKAHELKTRTWSEQDLQAHDDLEQFPLTDLVSEAKSFIVEAPYGSEGVLATLVPPSEWIASKDPLEGIPVRTRYQIVFREALPAQSVFQSAIESLAQELRKHELTDKMIALETQDTAEGKEQQAATLKELKEKMKEMVQDAIKQNQELGPAIDAIWGSRRREMVWVRIGDWYHHNFRLSKMPADQIWYID